ncbi:hypothetical protein FF38_03258 [Lucilia cuprina]|uniref:Uncharacterized protein n=1 Tax=Lucilia cuprina TaxID=7375 RepID=A0A0L0CJD4_LUCCU|nr:hypothetical protein FF38_03258 [Lucilia cuprina]
MQFHGFTLSNVSELIKLANSPSFSSILLPYLRNSLAFSSLYIELASCAFIGTSRANISSPAISGSVAENPMPFTRLAPCTALMVANSAFLRFASTTSAVNMRDSLISFISGRPLDSLRASSTQAAHWKWVQANFMPSISVRLTAAPACVCAAATLYNTAACS